MPIEPTVSRMVWYRPGPRDCATGVHPIPQIDDTAPLHAMICGVLGPGRVNLAVFGADGSGPFPRVDVVLVQDNDPVQPGQCGWMPFQKGQANKPEVPAIDVGAVHAAIEAKGRELFELLATAEERVRAFLTEGQDKLTAAATHVENAVANALHLSPDTLPANPAPPATEQAQAQVTEPAQQG